MEPSVGFSSPTIILNKDVLPGKKKKRFTRERFQLTNRFSVRTLRIQ
jgi:hypothetical protein